VGTPKAAMMASPMNFSRRPPHDSITSDIDEKYVRSRLRIRSGSSCSPIEVEPVMSAKRMVTTLRSSANGCGPPSGPPQLAQNRADGSFAAPHRGQRAATGLPQSGQNRAVSESEAPQARQAAIVGL